MDFKIIFVFVLITIEKESSGSRVKRSKYFPYPPPGAKIYRRAPPQPYYPKPSGAFSYTPPPNWMDDNPRQPPHVSKTQGLGDEDINNLVKYLSKHDLDKIIEFAGEKERDRPGDQENFERQVEPQRFNEERRPFESMEKYKVEVQNQIGDYSQLRPTYTHPSYNQDSSSYRDFNREQSSKDASQYNAEESVNYHTVYLNGPYAHHINNEMTTASQDARDSATEEVLPKPLNLREDNEAEGTSNVAAVTKPDSYEVNSFGDLPLMEYLSKLDTVSSYHVPHYSITSQAHHTSNTNYNSNNNNKPPSPPVEPAPPAHFAKQQSDAHLKAIKIWSHKSKGAAYTLNSDGTLSVERPLRPKPVYGPY